MEEKNQNRNQNPEQQQTPHKRRVRYKGTHPRRFEEKYKELNPEKYADTIEHVIQKGGTPAGMHISIMVKEILDFLQIKPGQKGLDATLGYGGHTRAMLEQLQGRGPYLRPGCRSDRVRKDKETTGRSGIWRGYYDCAPDEFCRYRPDRGGGWSVRFYSGGPWRILYADR